MKKRLLALLLVFVMVLGMFPVTAMATGTTASTDGVVYISASHDGKYLDIPNNGGKLAYVAVNLSDLEKIDLDTYGLSDYKKDGNGNDIEGVTVLKLFIYVHTQLLGLNWKSVTVTGSSGSMYFKNGLFGYSNQNVKYYVNGEYPLEKAGWGATADRIVLNSGDYVDVVHYSSSVFDNDYYSGFHYFRQEKYGDTQNTHAYTVKAGETLTATLALAVAGQNYTTEMEPVTGSTFVDADSKAMPIYFGATAFDTETAAKYYPDDKGQVQISTTKAGTYYLWADGGYGTKESTKGKVVSSPAYAVVTVKEAAATTYTVTLPTGEGYTVAAVDDYTTTVTKGGDFKFTVTLADGYKKGAGFAVKAKIGDAEAVALTDADGVYTLLDIQSNMTITVEGVEKETTTSTAWDGTTKTEPKQVDGVYQISTGAELAWFVDYYEDVTDKTAVLSGKLTADIDLNNQAWVANSTSAKCVILLDGDGHTISGLNSTLGLIGNLVKNDSVIKNLTVSGNVKNENGDILGGIVAKATTGTIENCVNYVNVTGKRRVGGITGYNANVNAKILNCANYGTIKATEDCAGGIVGHMYTGMTITGCYNAGTVSGKKLVGGLVGGSPDAYKKIEKISDPATITGCYNIGTITGGEYVGGLMGHATGKSSEECTKVTDCYSAGTITGTTNVGALFGLVYGEGDPTEPFATIETTYYLNTATDSYGTAKTEAELKSADGMNPTYFRSSCGGYPALVWQTDDNHTPKGVGVVTEATCTSAGYTTYTCSVCTKQYKADWTPALGHDFCDHDVTQICTSCAAASGILVRKCKREGCEATKEETIPTFHTVTLPTGTGYTVAAKDGASTTVTEGSSFSFTVTIAADYKAGDDFAVKTNGTTLEAVNKVYTIENITADQTITVDGVVAKTDAEKKGFTVVAPAGSTITAGRFSEYYQYDFATPLEIGTKEDGSVYAIFEAGKYLQSFYRVQNPNGVTYWEFAKDGSQVFGAGEIYTVTAEMLHLNDTDFTKKTVYTDYSQNIHDKADIYLNINEKGYINLNVNETKELNVFRNWMSLDDTTRNTGAALPDVTYTVVPLDGTDVVTITPGTNNSCVATLTANSQGTAIVLVTYDAMTNAHADGGSRFSAIWPENTGVFVVSVGKDGSGITTNMTVNETVNTAYSKTALDAEHDILFYVGNAGASYSFKPEDGCDVTLAHGTISDGKLTFGSFVKTGVSTATDGTVTLSGLTTGAHIVKVEKGGVATYQVIRARQVSYTITDAEGKTVDQSNPAEPGETVKIAFNGLISPMEKLSGVYNANYGFYYNGEKGVEVRTSTGYYGDYDYNRSSSKTPFSVTIPEDWNAATYILTDGAIRIGGYGCFAGAHRTQRYVPTAKKTDAEDVNGVLGVLPDIQIPTVYEAEKITVTLPTGAGYTVTGAETVDSGADYTFTVAVKGGYDGTGLVVKANGLPLTAQADDSYKVENVTAALTITVEGVAELTTTFSDSGTKVYDSQNPEGFAWFEGLDGLLNVKDLTLFGASVKEFSWNEEKSVCQITLSSSTESNAVIGFAISYGAMSGIEVAIPYCTATLNGSTMTAETPMAVRLVNGTATVSIVAGADLTDLGEGRYSFPKTFQISVAEGEPQPTTYTVALPESPVGYTVVPETGSTSPVAAGGSYSFKVNIASGYEATSLVVKANDTPLTAVDGVYTISNIQANQTVTVSGVTKTPVTYNVTLTPGTGYTLTGKTSSNTVVEGGSYSFTVTIADGYEKTSAFAVKANGTPLTANADGSYTMTNITANQTVTVEGVAQKQEETLTWQQAMEKTQKYLINQGKNEAPTVGSQSGEWLILGLARNGVSESFFNSYYNNVVSYVKENINSKEQLNESKSTDNSRVILALTAMGKDVTNVGGHNLLKGLSDLEYIKSQGVNGPVFALIALDSGDYAEPSTDVTRERLIAAILAEELPGGGWTSGGRYPDDMTPMAIQALAPYYDNDHPAVKTAVDKALTVMKGMVPTTDNAESFSQIVVALCALGIDCETEPGFETVLDSLLTFALKTGGFKRDGSANQMSTEQGFYALVAYNRLKQNKTRLYDMTDVVMKGAYSITVKSTTNGAVTVSTPKAVAGTTVTITVEPDLRYELDTLTVKTENGVAVPVTDNKFTMPKANVTVEATFKLNDHQAQDVMDAIDDMDVRKANAETQVALEALEAAYDALSEADKAKVTNYSQLRCLRNKFDELLDKAKKNAYEDVEDLLEDLDEKDYTEDNWKLILELMEQARKDIEKAKNTDELDDILDILKWDLDDIADGEDITVTFRLIGDFLHDSASAHEEYVTWIPTTTYTLEPGATVYDVFMEAMNDYGLNQKGASNNYVSTIQAPEVLGGYWLGEFDNGQNSGWMYTVNGSHPNVGLKACELQDGDRIIWHYVDDYTVEEYKFTWLEAEDISPEEYVKKHQKDVEFSDVSKNDWFYEDVQFVVKEGLFNGTGNSTFSPNASMTRAMLVTVLYRLEGEPKVTGASEFDDVAANQWYTNAVVWAAKHDIVGGYGDGKFGTNDSITREQMATILYRYAQYKKYDTKAANSLTGYSDFTSISAFALKGLKWANAEGLITGRTTTTLAPQGTATRAEVAAILHRFVENVKG